MDEATTELILNLWREDLLQIGDLAQTTYGSENHPTVTDSEMAFQEFYSICRENQRTLEDWKMARSMSRATHDDAAALLTAATEENNATTDHNMALRLGGRPEQAPLESPQLAEPAVAPLTDATSTILERLNGLVLSEALPYPSRLESQLGDTASPESTEGVKTSCISCTNDTSAYETLHAPCSHLYCKSCILKLVEDSLVDETLFPPRCCREPIPLFYMGSFLSKDLIEKYGERTVECKDTDRTYCANAHCSRYLVPPETPSRDRTCNACKSSTCTECKKLAHVGECPSEDSEILALAAKEGWQRCEHCRHLVELRIGCNHITCRCGHEFCYACGTKWKNCTCAQWDEARLYANRAERAAARDRQDPPPARDRNRCLHEDRWLRIEGSFTCEDCQARLPLFIFQCPHCRLRACVRCKFNRH